MDLNDVSGAVVDSAMRVHTALGPGLLERAYEVCLCVELRDRGLSVRNQVPVPLEYKGVAIRCAYRLDLLVDGRLVVEVKTVSRLIPVHSAQLLSYLRLTGHRVGLLINFHEEHLKHGIRRMING